MRIIIIIIIIIIILILILIIIIIILLLLLIIIIIIIFIMVIIIIIVYPYLSIFIHNSPIIHHSSDLFVGNFHLTPNSPFYHPSSPARPKRSSPELWITFGTSVLGGNSSRGIPQKRRNHVFENTTGKNEGMGKKMYIYIHHHICVQR